MFESLNMMIPFSALMTAAMALLPPISVPGILIRSRDRPLRRAGGGHLGLFHATHHQREGSPTLCGHYGPTWACGNRAAGLASVTVRRVPELKDE
jgi:hypothetical protein